MSIHTPLTTPRLLLRGWRAEDRAPFAAMGADPRVMEFFPRPLDREASDALVDRLQEEIDRRGWGLWAAEERASGAFVGFVGLSSYGPELPHGPAVEVGWRLALPFWGRGYATEGGREALRYAFEVLDVAAVFSFTAQLNTRSTAVMERLGMVREPAPFDHPRVPEGHPLRSHCIYRLDRGRWQELR